MFFPKSLAASSRLDNERFSGATVGIAELWSQGRTGIRSSGYDTPSSSLSHNSRKFVSFDSSTTSPLSSVL